MLCLEESLLFNNQYCFDLFTGSDVSEKISSTSTLSEFPRSRGTGAIAMRPGAMQSPRLQFHGNHLFIMNWLPKLDS